MFDEDWSAWARLSLSAAALCGAIILLVVALVMAAK
jgi:hypothetical protein